MTGLRIVVLVAIASAISGREYAASANVDFTFTGSVYLISHDFDPFNGGWTTNPPTPVIGHVMYDPSSAATDPIAGCDCMGYQQHIAGGFTALVGNTLFRADNYLVQVMNDFNQQSDPTQPAVLVDTLSVLWTSDIPALSSPLWVNGVAYSSALFKINLDSSSDTFMNTSLPQELDLGRFSNLGANILDDNRTDKSLALFNWSTLSTWGGSGDYNDSGAVNSSDYDVWRSNFGLTNNFAADGNVNGVVDAADYVLWRNNSTQYTSAAAVPEPASVCLLTLACVMLSSFAGSRNYARK